MVYTNCRDGLPPYAEIQLPSLVTQQPYAISLRLAVPATESNYALGNFMTTLTLSSSSNTTLASIRRPVSYIRTTLRYTNTSPAVDHRARPSLILDQTIRCR
jgi:Putative adipose-regulatory protein (Seipin)